MINIKPYRPFKVLIICLILMAGCQQQILTKTSMILSSPNFDNSQPIPPKYTCLGENISPQLDIQDVPEEAQSLALIMEDPDAPAGTWVHWLLWNIDPKTKVIAENSVPHQAVIGKNSWPNQRYDGPCPPQGAHRYFFKLYALKSPLNLPAGSNKEDLIKAMDGQIIEQSQLLGTFRKQSGSGDLRSSN